MKSPFPIVYAEWFLVFWSVNNAYCPKTALSRVRIEKKILIALLQVSIAIVALALKSITTYPVLMFCVRWVLQ